ncbi:MAG: glutathione peroxidase, partial [Betaproteobacteria bacterium]|nr:glutathione peroxidase [Betaproteobacteria bacterium]
MTTLNHFTVRRIDGSELALSTLTGQVVLIVNTASA